MKNFMNEKDFLPEVQSKGNITVTTDYDRVDKTIPFVNKVILNKLQTECFVEVEKTDKPYTYQVTEV